MRVSDDIHHKLKLKTLKEDISIQELFSNYIDEYLKDESSIKDPLFQDLYLSEQEIKTVKEFLRKYKDLSDKEKE